MAKRHHLLELALGSALWLAYVRLTRSMQPSLRMTVRPAGGPMPTSSPPTSRFGYCS